MMISHIMLFEFIEFSERPLSAVGRILPRVHRILLEHIFLAAYMPYVRHLYALAISKRQADITVAKKKGDDTRRIAHFISR